MMMGKNAEENNTNSKVETINAKIEGFTRSFNTLKEQHKLLLRSRHTKDRIIKLLIQFQNLHDEIKQYYDSVKKNNVKNTTVNEFIATLLREIETFELSIQKLYYEETTLVNEIAELDLKYQRIKTNYNTRFNNLHPNQKNQLKIDTLKELEKLKIKIEKIIENIQKYKNHFSKNTVKKSTLEQLQTLINNFIKQLSDPPDPPANPPAPPANPPPQLVRGGYNKTHKLQSNRNQKLKSKRKNNKITKSTKHKMKMNKSKLKKTHKK